MLHQCKFGCMLVDLPHEIEDFADMTSKQPIKI